MTELRWYRVVRPFLVCVLLVVGVVAANRFLGQSTVQGRAKSKEGAGSSKGGACEQSRQLAGHSSGKVSEQEYKQLRQIWVVPAAERLPQSGFLKPVETLGNPGAKLCLKAFYPFHRGHEQYREYCHSLAERFPGDLRVVCVNFGTSKGFELLRQHRLSCGTVILQGHPKADLQLASAKLPVTFSGPMGTGWKQKDLEDLIKSAIAATRSQSGH